MQKTKFTNNGSMGFKKILIASLLPFILYTVFALLFSGICYFSKDPTKGLGLYSLISLVLSGSISGFINSKTGNGKSMFLTVISTTIISFIMLLVSLIFSKDGISFKVFMNIVCYLSASIFATILGKGGRRKNIVKSARRR